MNTSPRFTSPSGLHAASPSASSHFLTPLQAGLVHRDLRLENSACTHTTPRRWFLLDLECCARPNQPAASLHTASIPGVLVDGCYTRASDIAMLGLLLNAHNARVTSTDGREFMEAVCLPANEQQHSTQQLLGFRWLRCRGLLCVEAGAQAWEAVPDKL